MRVIERKPVPEYRVVCPSCTSVLAVKVSDFEKNEGGRWYCQCPVCEDHLAAADSLIDENKMSVEDEPRFKVGDRVQQVSNPVFIGTVVEIDSFGWPQVDPDHFSGVWTFRDISDLRLID